MTKKKNFQKQANEWFRKADEDLKTAEILLVENGPQTIICFHCHQVIEKYLKGFLILQGIKLEKTHDLIKLLKDCTKYNPNFSKFLEQAKNLNAFYLATRYPVSFAEEYSTEETKEVLQTVKKIVEMIKGK